MRDGRRIRRLGLRRQTNLLPRLSTEILDRQLVPECIITTRHGLQVF